jgi:DNA-directed RNA polymerase subunit E'/Rpb7
MNTPYFNTYLYSKISVHPSQMNNDLSKHLKNNLIKRMQGKCYKSYGHITKIYNIQEKKGGTIVPEDTTASALYDVKFGCKLCKPKKGTIIICEIVKMLKSLILLRNGPIDIVIFEGKGHINETNFIYDDKRNMYLAKINEDKGVPVKIGTFVEIKVVSAQLENGSQKIMVIGTLEKLATQEQINNSLDLLNNDNLDFVKYDDYESSYEYKPEITTDEASESESESNSLSSSSNDEEDSELSSEDEDDIR